MTHILITPNGETVARIADADLPAYLDYTKAAQWRQEAMFGNPAFYVAANGDILFRAIVGDYSGTPWFVPSVQS